MKWTLSLLFVASVAKALPHREGKAFSLFSVVTFPNEQCQTTMANMVGQCVTAEECSSSGSTVATAMGNCASGFGVCCSRSVSSAGPTATEPVNTDITYIEQSPDVLTGAATVATNLMFPIAGDASICWIRLDFINAVFTQPTAGGANGGVAGTCGGATGDALTVTGLGVPAGFGALCGTLTGQHIYLPTGGANPAAQLNIATGTNVFARQYKILVTRLSCTDPDLPPSPDCRQYFTGLADRITSLNGGFVDQIMLRNLNYKICIRQGAGTSGLSLIEAGGAADSFALQAPAATTPANSVTGRATGGCTVEGIMIPNAVGCGLENFFGAPAGACPALFCGGFLNNLDNQATSSPVIALNLFGGNTGEIMVQSDNTASAANTGFDLIYQQF